MQTPPFAQVLNRVYYIDNEMRKHRFIELLRNNGLPGLLILSTIIHVSSKEKVELSKWTCLGGHLGKGTQVLLTFLAPTSWASLLYLLRSNSTQAPKELRRFP